MKLTTAQEHYVVTPVLHFNQTDQKKLA